jgi:hypothetical protein
MQAIRGQDCIGSVNIFKNKLEASLLMDRNLFYTVREQLMRDYDFIRFDIMNEQEITFKIHDKWGRPSC